MRIHGQMKLRVEPPPLYGPYLGSLLWRLMRGGEL